MRNPKWHRDEIILALDLYFRLNPGQIHSRNPEVQELSQILNRLPIHNIRPDEAKFRNSNGVGLKLSNFLAIDPDYHGKGMASYSQLDKLVFEEYAHDTSRLRLLASRIRDIALDKDLPNELYLIPEEEDKEIQVQEGAVIYKLHQYRERDKSIVKKKKELIWQEEQRCLCEACEFDFELKCGEVGHKYIECDHSVPLSEFTGMSKTTLNDLALVCSNCHRMLHRKIDTLSVEGLKQLLAG